MNTNYLTVTQSQSSSSSFPCSQVAEFGQIPKQLFSGPHPSRNDKTCGVLDFAAGITNKRTMSETDHNLNHSSNNHGPRPEPAAVTAIPPQKIEACDSNDNGARIINANNNNDSSVNMNAKLGQSTASVAASPIGVVGVMELGDDFRAEVEQQMLLMSPPSMNTSSNSSNQGRAADREEVGGHGRSRLVVNMHTTRRDNDDDMDPKATTSFQSEDVNAIPPATTTAIPSNTSSSSASSLKNRMWGLVTDTAMVVADHVDKHKDRYVFERKASSLPSPARTYQPLLICETSLHYL